MSKPTCYKSAYAEKLKDPRWKAKRQEIIDRDENRCFDCSDEGETKDVHHLHYIAGREPWEYADDYLITLCRGCHINRQSVEDEAKHEMALLFGKMNIWKVYEMMKSARELRREERPDCALIDVNLIKDPGF